jgi:hypothetical protein
MVRGERHLLRRYVCFILELRISIKHSLNLFSLLNDILAIIVDSGLINGIYR